MVTINASFAALPVGTGTYTRNITAALPEARCLSIPASFLAANPLSFWGKRLVEVGGGLVRGSILHPYWAADMSRTSRISVLDFVQYDSGTPLERALLRRAARNAAGILALSNFIAGAVEERLARTAVVAPPFPDREWFDTPRVPLPRFAGRWHIAYWGGQHPRKRYCEFLKVFDSLDLARDVTVHHPGGNLGWQPKRLRIVAHGLLSRRALIALVDSCHAAVYPSSEEGFGLPVFEALLRGRPVLTADLPVYKEFVKDALGRAVIRELDTAEVRSAVERLLGLAGNSSGTLAALRFPQYETNRSRLRSALLSLEGGTG